MSAYAVVAHFTVEADSEEAAEEQILTVCEGSDSNTVTLMKVESSKHEP
jgi:phosphoribosylformylglycinamidine (FGAM) synthase PurS component